VTQQVDKASAVIAKEAPSRGYLQVLCTYLTHMTLEDIIKMNIISLVAKSVGFMDNRCLAANRNTVTEFTVKFESCQVQLVKLNPKV
jgi:hypothetical protein